jgi:lysophospholipase L1-like esterase
VVAIGDSIVNGHGKMMLGVQCQSCAFWLAQAGGWCFTKHSIGGSTSFRIVDEQVPLLTGQYAVGVMNMGANDVLFDFDLDRLAANLETAVKALERVAEHVLILNLPDDLGVLPGAPVGRRQRLRAANQLIGAVAQQHDLMVLDISDFRGSRLMRADRIHPTALGQLEAADRAVELMRARGVAIPVQPSSIPLGRPGDRLSPGYLTGYAAGSVTEAARWTAKRLLRR